MEQQCGLRIVQMWSKGCAIAGARGHQISTLTRCPSADNECCGEGKSPKPVHGLEKRSDDLKSSKGELDRALNAPRCELCLSLAVSPR